MILQDFIALDDISNFNAEFGVTSDVKVDPLPPKASGLFALIFNSNFSEGWNFNFYGRMRLLNSQPLLFKVTFELAEVR